MTKQPSKLSKFFCLEPCIHLSFSDIVEAMNTLFHEKHHYSENCITVKVSRTTQTKREFYLANESSGLALFSMDLEKIFGSIVDNQFGVMLRKEGPHKPVTAYGIVRTHSLIKYTHLIETKLLATQKHHCCVFLILFQSSRLETLYLLESIWTIRPFSNLQFGPLLKKIFHGNQIGLINTSGKNLPFVSVGITRFVLMFRKASYVKINPEKRYKVVASKQVEIPFFEVLVDNVDGDSVHLHMIMGKLQFRIYVNISSQLQKA